MSYEVKLILIYVLSSLAFYRIGVLIRRWRERKFIADLKAYLGEDLPTYKKGPHGDKINWDRVEMMLKKAPPGPQQAILSKKVSEEIRRFYKRNPRK